MVYLKFRDSSFLRRCNNAEYAYVGTKVISLVSATGLETLGIPEEFFTKYQARKAVLTNLVSMSRSSVETTKINEMEAKIDGLLKYMLSVISKARENPIAAKKEASLVLYNEAKVYLDITKRPQQQKLEVISGLLHDFGQSDMAVHVNTLGLEAEVEQLTLLHAQFSVLLDNRSSTQMKHSEETSRKVRKDMDELFEMMIAIVWAKSLTESSEDLTSFIKCVNKVLSDAETAYNKRTAKRTESGGENTETPETGNNVSDEDGDSANTELDEATASGND
jgi:hypothetical protein